MYPTGALSVVQSFMEQAKACEDRMHRMVKNEAFNTAIEQKLEAEKLKTQAGIEFLLWMLATLAMPEEPNPWKEKMAKEKAARDKAEAEKEKMN